MARKLDPVKAEVVKLAFSALDKSQYLASGEPFEVMVVSATSVMVRVRTAEGMPRYFEVKVTEKL